MIESHNWDQSKINHRFVSTHNPPVAKIASAGWVMFCYTHQKN